jgi:hypothetical protein
MGRPTFCASPSERGSLASSSIMEGHLLIKWGVIRFSRSILFLVLLLLLLLLLLLQIRIGTCVKIKSIYT